MKKFRFSMYTLMGAALALGASAAILNVSKESKPVLADNPEVFYIGNHNLLENPICNDYGGTAVLTEESGEYVLTLTDFNNNGIIRNANPGSAETFFSGLSYHNPTKNLTIRVSGTCTIYNADTSATGHDNNIGIYVATSFATPFVLNIEGVDGTNPKLITSSPAYQGDSFAFICASTSSGTLGTVNVSDCVIEATAGASVNSYGLYFVGCQLNVLDGADITATSNGVNDSAATPGDLSVGIYADAYNQTAGKVVATAGNVTSNAHSWGMRITKGNASVTNGRLIAQGGTSVNQTSAGIYLNEGSLFVREDADVTAIGGNISSPADSNSRSAGVFMIDTDNDNADIDANANYFYAATLYTGTYGFAVNFYILPRTTGYGSASNVFTNPTTITPSNPPARQWVTYKQILFVKQAQFDLETESADYDGNPHAALSLTDVRPTSYTAQFRVDGSSEWSSDIPEFTDANEDGYVVYYRVQCAFCDLVEGHITFQIFKSSPSITTLPTKAADFTADGQAHPLATAGVVEGGTIMYSVNDGDYSATIPTATNAGTYSVSYKVAGDANHDDTEPVSLGTVTVSSAPVPPEPGPTPVPPEPTPTPSDNGSGLPGWAIALIVVGSLLLACCAAIVLLFVFWPRYVVDSANKVIIRTILVFKKDDKVYLVSNKCKLVKAEKANVYKTKEEAEKALNK